MRVICCLKETILVWYIKKHSTICLSRNSENSRKN